MTSQCMCADNCYLFLKLVFLGYIHFFCTCGCYWHHWSTVDYCHYHWRQAHRLVTTFLHISRWVIGFILSHGGHDKEVPFLSEVIRLVPFLELFTPEIVQSSHKISAELVCSACCQCHSPGGSISLWLLWQLGLWAPAAFSICHR